MSIGVGETNMRPVYAEQHHLPSLANDAKVPLRNGLERINKY